MQILRKILKPFLKVSSKNVKIDVRGFECSNNSMRNHLEKIGSTFLVGYHLALNKSNLQDINFQNIDTLYRGFAYEGAAMALSMLDILTLNKCKRIHLFIDNNPKHIYMLHVGVGWALARLPFINIKKYIEKYDKVLRSLIIDGYGFHQAYFKTKRYVYNMKTPLELTNSHLIHNFYQGVGRALWFVYGGCPHKIKLKIETFNEIFHSDLWAGLGLAAAYAGGMPQTVIQDLSLKADNYRAELAQGVAFACKTRQLSNTIVTHTELASKICCNLTTTEASEITDIEYQKVIKKNIEGNLYSIWRQNIIKKLNNQFINENTYTEALY